jgi:hypothetical protein
VDGVAHFLADALGELVKAADRVTAGGAPPDLA